MAGKKDKDKAAKKAAPKKSASSSSAKKEVFLVEPSEALSVQTNYGMVRKGRPKRVEEGSAEYRHYSSRTDVRLRPEVVKPKKKADKADG